MLEQLLDQITENLTEFGGAFILKPKTTTEKNIIKSSIVNNDLPIAFADLSVEDENILLLRHRPIVEDFNFNENIVKAKEYFYNGDYASALDCYLKLLKIGKPKTPLYMKIATCYAKMHDLVNAIRYFEIAYYLDRKLGYDATRLKKIIDALKTQHNIVENIDYNKKMNSFIENVSDYLLDHDSLTIKLKFIELGYFKYLLRLYPNIVINNITTLENEDTILNLKRNQLSKKIV